MTERLAGFGAAAACTRAAGRPITLSATQALALALALLALSPPLAAQPAGGSAPALSATPAGGPGPTANPAAPRVALSGRMGPRALLVIDGRPRTVAVGETVDGVRLLGWREDAADVQVGTQRLVLRVGGAPVDLTRASATAAGGDAATTLVLQADVGGHYVASGSINGRSTRFMVDTGATLMALSQAEADRLGIAFRDAPRGMAQTANGEVPVHRVVLQTVRVGSVELPALEAVVLPAAMPHVLLGNNFLERFDLKRADGRMTLQRRP